jgi:hypothetical protein
MALGLTKETGPAFSLPPSFPLAVLTTLYAHHTECAAFSTTNFKRNGFLPQASNTRSKPPGPLPSQHQLSPIRHHFRPGSVIAITDYLLPKLHPGRQSVFPPIATSSFKTLDQSRDFRRTINGTLHTNPAGISLLSIRLGLTIVVASFAANRRTLAIESRGHSRSTHRGNHPPEAPISAVAVLADRSNPQSPRAHGILDGNSAHRRVPGVARSDLLSAAASFRPTTIAVPFETLPDQRAS